MKRRIDEFGVMISTTTDRNPMDFNGYGNWCGLGGSGDTVDAIDELVIRLVSLFHTAVVLVFLFFLFSYTILHTQPHILI